MGSLENTETTGMGVEFYRWVLGTLSFSSRATAYRRLNTPVKKRVRLARLGKRRTKALKLKRFPRLRLRFSWLSPFTLLAKLRDTYISFLQSASNKFTLTEGLGPFPSLPCDFGPSPIVAGGGGSLKAKERELDKILELYLARTRPQLLLTNDDC